MANNNHSNEAKSIIASAGALGGLAAGTGAAANAGAILAAGSASAAAGTVTGAATSAGILGPSALTVMAAHPVGLAVLGLGAGLYGAYKLGKYLFDD
jgi:hypothetical protein